MLRYGVGFGWLGFVLYFSICDFSVYVGEKYMMYMLCFAMFFVRLGFWMVVGVDDLVCGLMLIVDFKKLRVVWFKVNIDEVVDCFGD